jgi:hypothetical protein
MHPDETTDDDLDFGNEVTADTVDDDDAVAAAADDDDVSPVVAAKAAEEGEEETPDEEEALVARGSGMVPIARLNTKSRMLDEERRRVRELEDQLEAARTPATAPATASEEITDVAAQLREVDRLTEQARLDGDIEKAVEYMAQARELERYMYLQGVDANIAGAQSNAVEQVRLDGLIDSLEDMHDEFNPDSELYDDALVGKVVEVQSALAAAHGYSPSVALLKSVEYLMPNVTSQSPAPARKGLSERAGSSRTKAIKAAAATPPNTAEVGRTGDSAGLSADLTDISRFIGKEQEFDALPESTLAKLRGDFV